MMRSEGDLSILYGANREIFHISAIPARAPLSMIQLSQESALSEVEGFTKKEQLLWQGR